MFHCLRDRSLVSWGWPFVKFLCCSFSRPFAMRCWIHCDRSLHFGSIILREFYSRTSIHIHQPIGIAAFIDLRIVSYFHLSINCECSLLAILIHCDISRLITSAVQRSSRLLGINSILIGINYKLKERGYPRWASSILSGNCNFLRL